MSNIMISVIIPTYKRNNLLPRAIDSILNNSGSYEIIVVDDNGEDTEYRKNNIKKLKKYETYSNFKYIKHKSNLNGAAARNTGIRIAQGEYITFLDDDDEFDPKRISSLEKMIRNKKYDLIFTGYIIKKNGNFVSEIIPDIVDLQLEALQILLLKQQNFFGTGSNLICRKELINKINGFDEAFQRHQDIEFLIRFLEECKTIGLIPECLVTKNCEDIQNLPNVTNMLNVKTMFLEKFSYIIERQNQQVKNDIIYCNFRELLYLAYTFRDKEMQKKLKKLLKDQNLYNWVDDMTMPIKIYIRQFLML